MNSWRLPTSEELSFIYENKDLYDLKIDELFVDNPRICNEWSDNSFSKVWLGSVNGDC